MSVVFPNIDMLYMRSSVSNLWHVMVEQSSALSSSSADQQSVGLSPLLTLVSFSKTLNYYYLILQMGGKAVCHVCCVY